MYYEAILNFKKMLTNADGWFTKAAAFADTKKFDVNVLAEARLAPDMYSLTKQVQSACDAAKFCAAYLSGKTPPKHEDNEITFAELRARLKKVISYLEEFKAEDFRNAGSIKVAPGWAKGQWLPGEEYLIDLATPNFYFHLNTMYAILRHSGVAIGKMDYLASLKLRD